MTNTILVVAIATALIGTFAIIPVSDAHATFFFDETSFINESGATVVVSYPSDVQVVTGDPAIPVAPYVENSVVISSASGFGYLVSDRSPAFAGREYTTSGSENIDINFPTPIEAFGTSLVDGFGISDSGGCILVDSSFTITFKNGGTTVDSLNIDAPPETPVFIGFVSSQPFDTVEIREDGTPVGMTSEALFALGCENDYMSKILTAEMIDSDGSIPVGGELIPLDTTALIIGYSVLNAYWLAPIAIGIGAGIYLTRNRLQKH